MVTVAGFLLRQPALFRALKIQERRRVAQLGERFPDAEEVVGSSPAAPTRLAGYPALDAIAAHLVREYGRRFRTHLMKVGIVFGTVPSRQGSQ